jgi:sugar (pentulose or hexulose) kinase
MTLVWAASGSPAGAAGLLFVPYLSGERSPWYDAGARGSFIGLREDHRPQDLARAVVEGVTQASALAWETIDRSGMPEPATLTLAGGGARDAGWAQIVADVYGYPVSPSPEPDQSARGAAILALAMLEDADPAAEAERINPASTFALRPAPERVALYRERRELLAAAYLALRPITARLATGDDPSE